MTRTACSHGSAKAEKLQNGGSFPRLTALVRTPSLLKMLLTSLLTVAGAAASVNAQSATSIYVEPTVPTGTPVPGNYTGALRPQIHFSPPSNFMNDPNGMFIDADGVYHLYYQCMQFSTIRHLSLTAADNPIETVAGNQHWGHATSRDLYHWENQPIAIYPGNKSEGIFSGSAVVDANNTSGFFSHQTNGVVAIYTLNSPNDQSQNLAISYDSGYTFEKYAGNPVLSVGSTQFRDPKVIWYAPTKKWVMVVAYAQEFAIGIFTSDNLVNWTAASNFSYHGLLGFQWEVPNLVELPMENSTETMWIMQVSINPGAPLGGSITQYSPGQFNGTHFSPVDSTARIADFGKDNYAGHFFYGIPGNRPQISIAWASNWQYSQTVPSGPREGWRSSMSLPRRNYLKNATRIGYVLVSEPVDLSPVVSSQPIQSNDNLGNGTVLVDFTTLESKTIYFELNITNIPAVNATGTANFTFLSSVTGESLSGGQYLFGDNPFWLNRGLIRGFDNPFFTDKFSTNVLYNPATSAFRLSGVLDRSLFEVFINGGEQSATTTIFPEQPLDLMVLRTAELNAGVKVSVKVWGLDSGWARYEDKSGTVVGNVTGAGKNNASSSPSKTKREAVLGGPRGGSKRLY